MGIENRNATDFAPMYAANVLSRNKSNVEMRRFVGLVLSVVLISSSGVIAARWIGETRASPLALLVTYPDGTSCKKPCLFGILPGETKAADAIALLASHPLTQDFDVIDDAPFTVRSQHHPDMLIKFSKTPDGLVDTIVLSTGFLPADHSTAISQLLPQPASFGDFVSIYGAPDYVCFGKDGVCTAFYVRSGLMVTMLHPANEVEPIHVDEPLSRLILFNLRNCPPARLAFRYYSWPGFTTRERYSRARRIQVMLRVEPPLSISVPCQP